jgi:gentisate 1,2-dioxygenase
MMALESLKKLEPDPYDGHGLEYINPDTGKSADPKIGSMIQTLPASFRGKAHRHMSSSVYHVFSGSGYTVINGERFDWEKGDFFVVPPWAWHEHVNASDKEEAILFSINDAPLYETLQLQREEIYEQSNGHQQIVRVFEPIQ